VQHLTFYGLVDREQYVNNRDDRSRGQGSNLFGSANGTGVATTKAHGKGPLPGDQGMYQLQLYPTTQLQKPGATAVFVCQYEFVQAGNCNVSFQLDGGTVIGTTNFDAFERKTFSVIVTGGTGRYRNTTGRVSVTSTNVGNGIIGKIQVTHNVPVLMLEPAKVSLTLRSSASVHQRQTLYSVGKTEQFIDNSDDERRGWVTNPFAMRDKTQENLESQGRASPFPGDESLFSLALYSAASQKVKVGTATFTCVYAFARSAFCDATYQIKGGTLFAAGTFSFDAKTFDLAIVGGTGSYDRASGDLTSSEASNGAQRVGFVLA
jgi:hypothetical protein